MKTKVTVVFLVSLSFFVSKIKAQGCSDAGFCTIGNMSQHSDSYSAAKKQKLTLILSSGVGDENVFVFTPGIQYDNQLNKNWAIQAKLTGNYASGNLGTATGMGDIIFSATYSLNNNSNWQTSFLLGTKLPLNNSDIRTDNKPLPMQYQSSLGTADILGGITIKNKKWLFASAFQLPVSGANRNTFLPDYWNTAAAKKYVPTNTFKRTGDVLLRAGYTIIKKNKININVGLLGIYHLGKDTYINGNISNSPIALNGSEGLTLNGTTALHYTINHKFSIGLLAGVPFVVRDIRPDGLTRKFVVSPEFILKF
ncbi:hypothetical protein [Ferruginibacter sp.]|nr:hypothetical protein [Ferruginibacter sp.]